MVALGTIAVLAFFILFLYLRSVRDVCRTPTTPPGERDEVVITVCGGLITGSIVTLGAMVPGLQDPGATLLTAFKVSSPGPEQRLIVNFALTLYVSGFLYTLWRLFSAWDSPDTIPLIKSSAKAYLAIAVTAVAALLGIQIKVS